MEGSANYLESMARIGNGEIEDVIVWGRIGAAKSYYLPSSQCPIFTSQENNLRSKVPFFFSLVPIPAQLKNKNANLFQPYW